MIILSLTFLEPQSKRQTVRLRHNIEKAAAAKKKKQRKLAKNVSLEQNF